MSVSTANPDERQLPAEPGLLERIRGHRALAKFRGDGLKALALRGTVWTIGSHGASQCLRLVSSLVLTRLLAPQAYGAMALVQSVLVGIELVTDAGIRPAIVQEKGMISPEVLGTARTVQALRGVLLTFVACAIALPLGMAFGQPMLGGLLAVAALTLLFRGFESPLTHVAFRDMRLGVLTAVDFAASTVSTVTTIAAAYWLRSAWALVIGAVCGATCSLVLSHTVYARAPRFSFEKERFKQFLLFGRWIGVSSTLTFLASQSDRWLLAKLVDLRTLGFFALAASLCNVGPLVVRKLADSVVMPATAAMARRDPGNLCRETRRLRLPLILLSIAVTLPWAVAGTMVVSYLYPASYRTVGMMVTVLSLGQLFLPIVEMYGVTFIAIGQPRHNAFLEGLELVAKPAMALGGWYFGGERGFVVGIAVSFLIPYCYAVYAACRAGIFDWKADAAIWCAAVVMGAVIAFRLAGWS